MSDIGDKIRAFITDEITYENSDTQQLTDDTPLLGGLIDSLGLMQLIAFLEEDFDVAIDDAEVTAENFRTVGDIERLVESKVRVG
jgi:acyl carrier protein